MRHPAVRLLHPLLLVLAVGLAGGLGSASTSVILPAKATVLPANPAAASAPVDATPPAREPASLYRSTVEVISCFEGETALRFEFETDPTNRAQARRPSPPSIPNIPTTYVRSSSAPPPRQGSFSWRAASAFPGPFTLLVQVPNTGAVGVRVTTFELEGPDGNTVSAPPGFDPRALVEIADPAIMRDVRVVRLTFKPDGSDWGLPGFRTRTATVEIVPAGGAGANEKRHECALASPAFRRLYEASVINYEPNRQESRASFHATGARGTQRPESGPLQGSRYLVIAADDVAADVESLVEVKREKGLMPRVALASDLGYTAEGIRTYIEDAYYGWDVPPEFVLLVGDAWALPTGPTITDNYFAALEGDDYLADVIVGRLPVDTHEECANIVSKALAYETAWLQDDPEWLASAALLVSDDATHGDSIYYLNTWFIHELMDDAGFAPIDTLFRKNGVTPEEAYAALNQGRAFVSYRGCASYSGWNVPFNSFPDGLSNGWRTPIVVSATCSTGGYAGYGYLSELWLWAGTPEEPRGGAAFFGTTTTGHGQEISWKRGYVDEGFFTSVFGNAFTVGEACVAGRLNLHAHTGDWQEFEGWNLLGDPEMPVWTGPPSTLTVHLEGHIVDGWASVELDVSSEGAPVEDAQVTCWSAPGIHALACTDAEGQATLSFEAAAPSTIEVSVIAKDCRPHLSTELLVTDGPFLLFDDMTVDDTEGGNGDGRISPGESALLSVGLINVGDGTATGAQAVLRTAQEHATIADSVVTFQSIAPDSTVWGSAPFRIVMSEDWAGDRSVPLELAIAYGDSVRTWSIPPVGTVTGALAVAAVDCNDLPPGGNGSGTAGAGENPELVITLSNPTQDHLASVEGVLHSSDAYVVVTAAHASFPDAAPGAVCMNASSPFAVSVAPDTPSAHTASLSLRISAQAPTYAYAETLDLEIDVAAVQASRPTGPDLYGYYAYDSTDSLYQHAPVFEWFDIAPPGPGSLVPMVTVGDNVLRLVSPPFLLRHFGESRYWCNVCSNGFLSLVVSSDASPENMLIPYRHGPSGYGPPSVVAPFWDDLDPSSGGDVYSWCDMEGHRFIVQFDGVRRKHTPDTETFQVIFYDHNYYPTPTGDSMILFQYESVSQADSCTVGINYEHSEHPQHLVGLGYVFDGDYAPNAAPISNGLAILFTTAAPESIAFPWLAVGGVELDDTVGGDGDGVPCPGETLLLTVELVNSGGTEAVDLDLQLVSGDSTVVVIDSLAAFADIAPGESGSNDGDPFVISVVGTPEGSFAKLWLRPGGNAGAHQRSILYHLPVGEVAHDAIEGLALRPCRPSPFAGGTKIEFHLPERSRATVRIYDVAGRLVKTVCDAVRDPGWSQAEWDGTNEGGNHVASGVYFVAAAAGADRALRKVVLLR